MESRQAIASRTFRLDLESEPGRVVRGRIDYPEAAETDGRRLPFVLVLHGFKGFMNWAFFPELGRRLAAADLVAVSFNMSGSGVGEDLENFTEEEAFAKNTYTRELEDVDSVREFVERSGLPWANPARAGIFGFSMGGAVALLHAAEREDYRAIATWSSVFRTDLWGQDVVSLWERQGYLMIHNARTKQDLRLDLDMLHDLRQNADRLDVRSACGRIRIPTLVVHGSEDETVPFSEGEALARALDPELVRFLPAVGAGHTLGGRHPLHETPPVLERLLAETVDHFHRHLTA